MGMMVNPYCFAAGGGGGAPAWTATLTIGSGETASDLTNYPLYVDLADMPAGFWSDTNEGKDLRAYIGGTRLPVDVAWCSVSEQEGAAFIKIPSLASGSSTVIDLEGDGTSDRVADNDTYGRNAVWADYAGVFLLGETAGDDRTGGVQASITADPDFFELIETSTGDLDSHQGICWDGTHYYTTDDNAIRKWNSSWTLVDSNLDPIGDAAVGGTPTVNHCGDPCVHNGKLYIPLERYPNSGGYNAHIVVFNASDLSFDTSFNISAQGHEVSSIAYCERDGLLYISDFDSNFNKLFKYDPADGSYEGQLTLSHNVQNTQGVTWWRDHFWLSQDLNDETVRVDYAGNCTIGNLSGGAGGVGFGTGTGGNYEGLGHRDDGLIQHIDPGTTERAEIWRPFRLAKSAGGGVQTRGVNGNVRAGSRASSTTFTMGCTFSIASKTANHCALSYVNTSVAGSTNTRASLLYRGGTTNLVIWDSANGFLECSPTVNPTLNQLYRLHCIYSGTSFRRIYVDGTQRNNQNTITAAPSTLNALWMGMEDADEGEGLTGKLGFVYLRHGVLSADWIAAEYSNLNAPSSFYSIS